MDYTRCLWTGVPPTHHTEDRRARHVCASMALFVVVVGTHASLTFFSVLPLSLVSQVGSYQALPCPRSGVRQNGSVLVQCSAWLLKAP